MNKLIKDGGERQTTFMLYLSGTKRDIGGNTVFPQLGISVKPKKGTALYWSNLKTDGKFDTRKQTGSQNLIANHCFEYDRILIIFHLCT